MTKDLRTFLLERIAEDEAVARFATTEFPAPWTTRAEQFGDGLVVDNANGYSLTYACYADSETYVHTEAAPHIARFDPARILAECAAKRAVIEHLAPLIGHCVGFDDWPIEVMLQYLAAPYSAHADYDHSWAVA